LIKYHHRDCEPHSYAAFVPMGRIGQADEIADAVVWPLSDEARYVTGHTLPVNGGVCAVQDHETGTPMATWWPWPGCGTIRAGSSAPHCPAMRCGRASRGDEKEC
jgi:hypothetical protein